MPELTAALHNDDQASCDLVIDVFDQMHNPDDLSLLATHRCIVPIAAIDQA